MARLFAFRSCLPPWRCSFSCASLPAISRACRPRSSAGKFRNSTFRSIAGLAERPGLSDQDMRQGGVSILNVFASWCAPCHQEQPLLFALAEDDNLAEQGVRLFGIAYKDSPEDIAPLSRRGWRSLCADRCRSKRTHRHRLRRLWRAGDVHHQGRRDDRLQIRRPDHRRGAAPRSFRRSKRRGTDPSSQPAREVRAQRPSGSAARRCTFP